MIKYRFIIFAAFCSLVLLAAAPTAVHAQNIAGQVVNQVANSWPWYLVRASGFVAAFCLFLIVLSGIGFITGHTFKFIQPIAGWATHRALGIALTVSLLIHMTGLLLDHFVSFNLAAILIPFASTFRPTTLAGINLGSVYVAYGVVAFYLIAIIVLTSLIWIDNKARVWRLIHFLSYLVAALVFFHGLMLGTDLQGGLLRPLWIIAGLVFAAAVIARLWRVGTLSKSER